MSHGAFLVTLKYQRSIQYVTAQCCTLKKIRSDTGGSSAQWAVKAVSGLKFVSKITQFHFLSFYLRIICSLNIISKITHARSRHTNIKNYTISYCSQHNAGISRIFKITDWMLLLFFSIRASGP